MRDPFSACLAAVLVQGNVPDPVEPILNAPVPSPEVQESVRRRFVREEAGDCVGHFLGGLPLPGDGPLQAADLGEVRPIAIADQVRGGP